MRELIVRPAAEADILDAALWYGARASGLGGDFLGEVDASLASVARSPERYPVVFSTARRVLMRRFPYALFFVVRETSITVVACMHIRRDPRRWRERSR